MRIATTLLLGVAVLTGANAVIVARAADLRPMPAVPQLKSQVRQAAIVPQTTVSPAAVPASPAKNMDTPAAAADPTAQASAPAGETSPSAQGTPAVQEAKNNAAGVIDAVSDKNPNDSNSIVATVNDESISDFELRQRMALYMALNGITQQLTPEQKTRIRGQILEMLESEKVQLQEAVKKKITVSPVEVDKRINAMMQDYRFNIEQLRQNLANAGASEEALRAQITASIAWQKAVQDEYGDRINITPQMVDEELARHAESANKPHYRVMEIFLPVDNPELDAKVKKDAEDVQNQLRQGASFGMVARQFSQHPSAATGGDMGWINDGQLAPELNAVLAKMEVGSISDPIRSTGGYYVLALRERQEPLGTKIEEAPIGVTNPAGTLHLARLLFPVDPRSSKAQLDQILRVANQIQQRYMGCAQLDDLHQKMTGTVYMDLGEVKLADLSPQIQEAMKTSRPGEAAVPFASDAGIELIGRCDKRVEIKTAYVMPTRQQVEDQLFQSQIAALARRYLRDLKRNANIQVRDDSKPDALIR